MISPRFAAPVAVVLALALVPTVIHSYRGARLDDGWRAAAIAESLDGMRSRPTDRKAPWVLSNFATEDWIERTYTAGRTETTLFVARSYDPKRLYHHPELALLRGTQTTPAGIARSTRRPDIPLHLVETERNGIRGLAAYALRYEDGYIEDPLMFQLRTSIELLVRRRKPLTLFMAHALAGRPDAVDEAPATQLLLAAIEDFERQAAARAGR
jgi:hypothetical protein